MRRQDRLVAPPYLRAAMNHEQGLEESGYYKKRTAREMGSITFWIWLIVIVAAVLALISTGHHDQEMTDQVNRSKVMSRQEVSSAQHAMDTELFIMRQAKNSAVVMDRYHVMGGRK